MGFEYHGRIRKKVLTVENLLNEKGKDFSLEVLAGKAGLTKRKIITSDINRPGLALAGYTGIFLQERIQIIGRTELGYLKTLPKDEAQKAVKRIFSFQPPCFIVAKGLKFPEYCLKEADRTQTPLLRTTIDTTPFIHQLSGYLDYRLAPEIYIHGDLVDVYGIGLLIVGESGIGKSECALDLVDRGHRLVADDLVKILRRGEGILMGYNAAPVQGLHHHIEIRGAGIVDIYSLYGIRALRIQKRIEVVVELVRFHKRMNYERIGLEEKFTEMLKVKIPYIRIPVIPGKNLALVCEVIAKNHLLKIRGIHPAKLFNQELMRLMSQGPKIDPHIIEDTE